MSSFLCPFATLGTPLLYSYFGKAWYCKAQIGCREGAKPGGPDIPTPLSSKKLFDSYVALQSTRISGLRSSREPSSICRGLGEGGALPWVGESSSADGDGTVHGCGRLLKVQ